jgi:hypothetical protein
MVTTGIREANAYLIGMAELAGEGQDRAEVGDDHTRERERAPPPSPSSAPPVAKKNEWFMRGEEEAASETTGGGSI